MRNNVMHLASSPYAEALAWITQHPASGSGISLARLLLTLRRGGYSISECMLGLDPTRLDLALRVIHHFTSHGGANEELIAAERHLEASEPSLVAVIQSAAAAREALKLKS